MIPVYIMVLHLPPGDAECCWHDEMVAVPRIGEHLNFRLDEKSEEYNNVIARVTDVEWNFDTPTIVHIEAEYLGLESDVYERRAKEHESRQAHVQD